MRAQLFFIVAALLTMGLAQAQAALSPGEIVGRWSPDRDCRAAGFAYVAAGNGLQHAVTDRGRTFLTPVRVRVADGVVSVQVDEKIYTFRLPTPNTLQPLGYTNTRNGLSVAVRPRTWYRCGQREG